MPIKKEGTFNFSTKIRTIAASFGAVVAILGSIWALDTHYASAADVAQLKQDLGAQIQQMRREKVEDILFDLDQKKAAQHGKLSPADQANYERQRRRLKEIQDQEKQNSGTSR